MLSAEGLSLKVASQGLAAYNMGGVFGALGCALLVTWFGSKIPLLFCCLGGTNTYLIMLGVAMLFVFFALTLTQRHIPRNSHLTTH